MASNILRDGFNQTKALTIKSLILQKRMWKTNLCQIFLPIICLVFIFILDVAVTAVIKRNLDLFKPYFLQTPNNTNIDGLMYAFKEQFSTEQRMAANDSSPRMFSDYEPPEFFYVSFNSSEISPQLLGEISADGSVVSGFLGSMFNISGLLRVTVNRTVVDNGGGSGDSVEQQMRVPYFTVIADGDRDIDSILYDFASNGTQPLAAGSYKFHRLNLNASVASTTSSPMVEFIVQADDLESTQFCESVNLVVGRTTSCFSFVSANMATNVHHTALKALTGGKYGIMGTSAQIPYLAQPPRVFRLGNVLGIFFFPLVLSLMLPVFTYTIVLEKEYKIREMMKLMGMKMVYYWTNTYVFQYLLYLISAVIFIVLCGAFRFAVIVRVSPLIWILALIGWGFSLVSFAMLLSSILKTTMVAVVTAYLVVLLGPLISTTLYITNVAKLGNWPWQLMKLVFPFPLVSIIYASTIRCTFDDKCHAPARDLVHDMDVGMGVIALFVDAIIYALLALYLDRVLPQVWGVADKPWFPIEWIWKNRYVRKWRTEREIAREQMQQSTASSQLDLVQHDDADEEVIKMEAEIESGAISKHECGVYVKHLRKEYEGNPIINWIRAKISGNPLRAKAAVKKLSLAIGKSECFGLLGMNGAGKSTTMNILSGIIYKTSGIATINGYNIDTDMDLIRREFGLCPQFDVLYEDLTCAEHLQFYARIKSVDNVKQEVDYLLEKVQLAEKRNTLAQSLSGGMRRRLSIAISLVGNPKTIVLDEPTTGLDPATKRTLWDLIIQAKKDKCVILTTHSLEEADVLCDRIGIMTRGIMSSLGNSLSLKSRYGKGYRISINFLPENKDMAHAYLKSIVPEAEIHTEFLGNIIYEMPKNSVKISRLFTMMEKERYDHGIIEWSINQGSLEDVFLTIARTDDEKNPDRKVKRKCIIM